MKTYDDSGSVLYDIDEGKEIARGGEGRILDLSSDKVAKIYLPGITPISRAKFKRLDDLRSGAFVKPEELLFDRAGNAVGFTMKKVPPNFYPLLSIFNKNFCTREGISEKTKFSIFERLIDAVKFAHSKGIVIGDLNPYNIMINDGGLIHMLDVDSYETPSDKHSGVLLEDIRDFLYGGNVSVNSDYFALSVLIFNGLTYVHPFKGTCKTMPKISDRMSAKKSVLGGSPDIIVPKCYEPIQDQWLVDQFRRIFDGGERFVVNLKNTTRTVARKQPAAQIVTKTGELIIHLIHSGGILDARASKERLAVLTSQNQLTIYDVSLKGSCVKILEKHNVDPKSKLFVCGKKVYGLMGRTLYDVVSDKQLMTFDSHELKACLFGGVLVIVTENVMTKINMSSNDEGLSYTTAEVFGGKFNSLYSMFQNVSGNTAMFYDKGGLNTVLVPFKVRNLHQAGSFAMAETVANERTSYRLISMKNLKAIEFDSPYDSLRMFDALNEDLLVFPEDDRLSIVSSSGMNEVVGFKMNEVSADSIIHCTNAGIIVRNSDAMYCVNKK